MPGSTQKKKQNKNKSFLSPQKEPWPGKRCSISDSFLKAAHLETASARYSGTGKNVCVGEPSYYSRLKAFLNITTYKWMKWLGNHGVLWYRVNVTFLKFLLWDYLGGLLLKASHPHKLWKTFNINKNLTRWRKKAFWVVTSNVQDDLPNGDQ